MRSLRKFSFAIIFIIYSLNAFSQIGIVAGKLRQGLTEQRNNDVLTEKYLNELKPDGSWADIRYDDRSNTNWDPVTHSQRLLDICRAYNKPGSKFYHSPDALAAVRKIIDFYIEKKPKSDNWWFNAIGAPQNLGPALVLLKPENGYGLEQALLEKYAAVLLNYYHESAQKWPTATTGANKIWLLGSSINKACVMNNESEIKTDFHSAFEEAAIMTGRAEGIKNDNSFWQHGPQLYGGGYGMSFLADITYFGLLANGTTYAMSSEQMKVLSDALLDGWQWFIQRGSFDFSAVGREISRKGAGSSGALRTYAARLIEMGAPRQDELKALISFIDGKSPFLHPGNRYFWRSDIMIQKGADYHISARFPSQGMNATESMNRENLKRKWLPWGAMNIMKEGTEYKNIYGLWDWSRIPGVTSYAGEVKGLPLEGGAYFVSESQFAGGASDGKYGMAAYDYKWDGVSARKSWFFTPEGVYCMGSSIKGASDKNILTCVNQSFSSGDVIASEGKKNVRIEGEQRGNIKWIWHDGFGYFFPGIKDLSIRHSVQKGSWYDINTSQSNEIVEGKVFTAWFNHSSEIDGYEYAVVPSGDASVFKKWLKKDPFTVIKRNNEIHAIYNRDADLGAVAFFAEGTVEIKKGWEISCDSPCIVLVRFSEKGRLNISVADPSKKLASLNISVNRKLNGADMTSGRDGSSKITFTMPSGDDAGKTVAGDFTL